MHAIFMAAGAIEDQFSKFRLTLLINTILIAEEGLAGWLLKKSLLKVEGFFSFP